MRKMGESRYKASPVLLKRKLEIILPVMTRSSDQGYFDNLHINLDSIIFGILFFQM